jgi:hypothetical protein
MILKVVPKCVDAEYKTWLKTVTELYPIQIYLHQIGKTISDVCPHCTQRDT